MATNRHQNFRLRGIPLEYRTGRDVLELVMSIISLGPGASVNVHSLALNPVDRNSKVATLSFDTVPVSLCEESKDQWKFQLPADGDQDTLNTNRTLILDTHFTGFTPIQHSDEDNCDVDVIAISGLGGHAFGSFKERGGSFMWLRDALPFDIPNARILIYGYDTQLVESSSFQNLTDLGRGLQVDIKGIREPSQSRPILFIGHSLGGLVIKEAICKLKEEMDEAGASILGSTCGFLFFGVPHQGMAIESLNPLVKGQANRGLLESLSKNSALLMRLKQDFRNAFSEKHIPIISFYETEKSPTAVKRNGRWELSGPSRVLVDVSSATCGSKNQHPIDRSHSEMVKYSDQYDKIYQRVKTVLQSLLPKAPSISVTMSAETGNNSLPPRSTKSIDARESHFCVPFGRNRDFVGRESILKPLLTIIPPSVEVDDCQRTAIEGLGGVGKTQIALEAAFRVRDQYPGCSIFWVPAVDATSFENAYREIGRQLGVKEIDEDKADVKTLVREALSRESSGYWLLIIDNADDPNLLFGGMALSDCLPFSRKGSVLFTTRRREVAVRLDIPERNIVSTEAMNEPEAMDLLLKGLNSQGSNPEDVKRLVVFLEKLPLAIKQASAYIAKSRMRVAKYLDHCKSSDKTLIKLLSKDFEDRRRYKGTENPVATTWLISFEHIARDNPVAARYLKFICFLAEKDIPISLLPPASDELEADEAIGILKTYAFITSRENHDSFDMHRLVRLATRNWLNKEGKHEECVTEVIQRLRQAFPPVQSDNKGRWIKYLPHLEAALGSRERSADKSASVLLRRAGRSYYVLGQYHQSEQKRRQAVELQQKLLGNEHPQTLKSMHSFATALTCQGRYKEAEAMYRQTVGLMLKVLGEDSQDTINCMCNFGVLLRTLGEYEEAEQMLRQTLGPRAKVLDKDDPKLSYSMYSVAAVLSDRGKHKEGEGLCRQALEQMRTRLGEEDPRMLSCMATLGYVLVVQEKYEEAESVIRQTMDGREKVLGKDHPDTLRSMSALAFVLNSKGNVMEAEGLSRRALQFMRNVVGEEHPYTLGAMHALASVLSSQGEYEEAESMLRRTVELKGKVFGKAHLDTLTSLTNLAIVLKRQGKQKDAVALMEMCYQVWAQKYGPDDHLPPLFFRALNNWKLEGQE